MAFQITLTDEQVASITSGSNVNAPVPTNATGTWTAPAKEEYDAGAKLPKAINEFDLIALQRLARVGRDPNGKVVRSFEALQAAFDQIGKLERSEETYFARYNVDWPAQQWLVICGEDAFGFKYQEPFGVLGVGVKASDFADYNLQSVAHRFFYLTPGQGPGDGTV